MKHKLFFVGILLIVLSITMFITDGYSKYRSVQCTVLDKLQDGGRRSSYFYLVLRDDKSRVFDLIVSPATYSRAVTGQRLTFDLREFDIRQTPMNNLYSFLYIVVFATGLSILIAEAGIYIFNKLS